MASEKSLYNIDFSFWFWSRCDKIDWHEFTLTISTPWGKAVPSQSVLGNRWMIFPHPSPEPVNAETQEDYYQTPQRRILVDPPVSMNVWWYRAKDRKKACWAGSQEADSWSQWKRMWFRWREARVQRRLMIGCCWLPLEGSRPQGLWPLALMLQRWIEL